MITGIDRPTSGEILVGGVDIHRMTESQRSLWRGKNLGIVFQFFQLLPMLSLLENTMLPMDYTNSYPAAERPKRALELLHHGGARSLRRTRCPPPSPAGSSRARPLPRALATDPPIIVADEPTGNLDSRSANRIIDLFKRLVDEGKTILIVTHDPSITELTERTVIISDGELIDENVARALPLLNHRQLMAVTRLIQRSTVQPGAGNPAAGRPGGALFHRGAAAKSKWCCKPAARQSWWWRACARGSFSARSSWSAAGIRSPASALPRKVRSSC